MLSQYLVTVLWGKKKDFCGERNEVSLHVAVRDLRGTISECCVDGNMFLMSWGGDEIRSGTSSLSSETSVLAQR